MYIKIPGTEAGRTAIEESIFAGVPINVTLLFSREQYLGAAEAFMRGVERRIDAGLDPSVPSVASLFISRWDVAVADEAPVELRNRLGIAVGKRTYRAYRELLDSERMQRLANEGARPQRLLWASTGTKDPDASDTLYVEALAAPFTVNTMPEKTLLAVADHGEVGEPMPADGGDAEDTLRAFGDAGHRRRRAGGQAADGGRRDVLQSWAELLATVARSTRRLRPLVDRGPIGEHQCIGALDPTAGDRPVAPTQQRQCVARALAQHQPDDLPRLGEGRIGERHPPSALILAPRDRDAAVGDIEHRIARDQRCGVTVWAESEVDEVEAIREQRLILGARRRRDRSR